MNYLQSVYNFGGVKSLSVTYGQSLPSAKRQQQQQQQQQPNMESH